MAAEGDLTIDVVPRTEPVAVDGSDEIAELGRTFNDMLAKATASIEAYSRTMRARTSEMARVAGEIRASATCRRASRCCQTGTSPAERSSTCRAT